MSFWISWILVLLVIGLGLGCFLLWREQKRISRNLMTMRGLIQTSLMTSPLEEAHAADAPEWFQLREILLHQLREFQHLKKVSAQSAFYETLFNEVSHALILVDEEMTIRFSNQAVFGFFPWGGSIERRPLMEVVREHHLVDLVRRAIDTKEIQTQNIHLPSGRNVPVRDLHAESGPLPEGLFFTGAWLLMRDITQQVVTEQIRKDFVANASHELKTPLSIIRGYVENLLDGVLDRPETIQKSLKLVEKHCMRIQRIVEDMLTISRLEGSAPGLKLEPFVFQECVLEVLELLGEMLVKRQAFVCLNLQQDESLEDLEEPLILTGDRFYWTQILTNLIENALKENERMGLRLEVCARKDGDWIEISVNDDGIGIPRAEIPHVFKRFYRVAKHHSQAVPGTGLGLSIVKRAIEAHGGEIDLVSLPGTKTSFIMRVPVISGESEKFLISAEGTGK